MSPRDEQKLADLLQAGQLNSQQEKQIELYLAAHPEQRAGWEEELALNQLLKQLGDAPLSSNFTARVLAAVRHETSQTNARRWTWPAFGRWLPRLATAAALVSVGLFLNMQRQMAAREELARHLSEVAKLGPAVPLELLENFDAINRLNQVPHDTDRELIAALQ